MGQVQVDNPDLFVKSGRSFDGKNMRCITSEVVKESEPRLLFLIAASVIRFPSSFKTGNPRPVDFEKQFSTIYEKIDEKIDEKIVIMEEMMKKLLEAIGTVGGVLHRISISFLIVSSRISFPFDLAVGIAVEVFNCISSFIISSKFSNLPSIAEIRFFINPASARSFPISPSNFSSNASTLLLSIGCRKEMNSDHFGKRYYKNKKPEIDHNILLLMSAALHLLSVDNTMSDLKALSARTKQSFPNLRNASESEKVESKLENGWAAGGNRRSDEPGVLELVPVSPPAASRRPSISLFSDKPSRIRLSARLCGEDRGPWPHRSRDRLGTALL
ncbi:hypothetical protein M5K25_028481 [Dendrobium thyrsiflorum]|uniref:Uncharacterized protein n=1 Tax=Dendrobium thyrsiflorum TaxID=117978 RepID=A0ABD0TT74_DENTH